MFDRLKKDASSFTQPTKEHWDGLGRDLKSRLDHIQQGRDADQTDLEANFQHALTAWGMSEDDIPHVLRDLKIRVMVFLLALLPSAFLLLQEQYVCAACFAVVSLVGSIITLWRIRVLKNRHFKPLCNIKLLYHKFFVGKKRP